jgi:hypothetical protein
MDLAGRDFEADGVAGLERAENLRQAGKREQWR